MFKKSFENKKILITGHTGFKGSWLTLWLSRYNCKIVGVSKDYSSKPSHYKILEPIKNLKSIFFDIEDSKKINKLINSFKPDFIFHLAAQPLVRISFKNPVETFKTNMIGTLNILESLRNYKKKCYAIIITSDKCYENKESNFGYNEKDKLGGVDPYSASKAGAELISYSYYQSYFKFSKKIFITTARAGNVIGGGDWSSFRIIPDCVKAWNNKKTLIIRNPNSIRPWQHVFETLSGYMCLAANLKKYPQRLSGESFNFGPSEQMKTSVKDLIIQMSKYFNNFKWEKRKEKKYDNETEMLKLDSKKATQLLNWRPVWTESKAIKYSAEWYKYYYQNKKNNKKIKNFSLMQIEKYIFNAKKKNLYKLGE